MASTNAGTALHLTLEHTRPELVIAALLHLVTAYRRDRCPGLASCIARHFTYLASHPRADKVLCEIAAASVAEWESAAREVPQSAAAKKGWLESLLH